MANTQTQPLLRYNTFAELQKEICDILNIAPVLAQCNVQFIPENRLDIESMISTALQKQGIAAVVMTPDGQYIGYRGHGCVYQLNELTLMLTEYTPINRAKNKAAVATGLDIANFCAETLAGPDAIIGFGKLNLKGIEQGEDNGLLVTKVTFQTTISNEDIPPYIWIEYATKEELSAAIADLSATVDSRLSDVQSRWGNITGDLSDQTDLQNVLDGLSDAIDINTSDIGEISVGLEAVQNELATTSALLSGAIDYLSDAIDDTNEAVEELAESKADKTDLSAYARKANTSIDYNSTTKKITLDADGHQTQIDATAFIKDGMVDNARYDAESKMIVITFNTDAGKEPISVDVAALVHEYTAGTGLILDNAEFSVDTTVIAQKSDLDPYALSVDVDERLEDKAALTAIEELEEKDEALSAEISSVVTVTGISGDIYHNLSVVHIKQDEYYELLVLSALQPNCLYVLDGDEYIDAFGQQIKNVATPTDLSDATTKKYVDDAIACHFDPSVLSAYALSSDVDSRLTAKADLTAIGDATVTINQDGVQKAQFTLNQKNNVTVNLEKGDEAAWGNITGEISAQTDLKQVLDVKVDRIELTAYALQDDIEDLSAEVQTNKLSIGTLDEKKADKAELSGIVFVKDADGNTYSKLSVVHISQREYYEQMILSTLIPNCLYVLDTDEYVDASGRQIKNVAEPTDLSDVTTKWYVDNAISSSDISNYTPLDLFNTTVGNLSAIIQGI